MNIVFKFKYFMGALLSLMYRNFHFGDTDELGLPGY